MPIHTQSIKQKVSKQKQPYMQPLNLKQRLTKYLIHFLLSILFPIFLIIILIIITGSRETGISYGLFVSFLILNIAYSFYFLKSNLIITMIAGILVTISSIGSAYFILFYKIKPSFDFYGFYTSLFVYGIISILSWETIYKILVNKTKKVQ